MKWKMSARARESSSRVGTTPAKAVSTAFTYQGRLDVAGVPANGTNDLTFTLYDAVNAGATVGTSNTVNDLVISNGLFTVTLDFGAGADTQGNEIGYALNVPSYATTALYHGKVTHPGGAAGIAAEARAFASGPYLAALLKGNALSPEEHAAIRKELSRLTGLDEGFLERANLRVTPGPDTRCSPEHNRSEK